MLLENVKKKERKSQLIKTKVKEMRFMEIPPKALGYNAASFRILLLEV